MPVSFIYTLVFKGTVYENSTNSRESVANITVFNLIKVPIHGTRATAVPVSFLSVSF